MKDLTITAIIKVYQYDELNEADQSLMKTAMEATARSYAPYSHFSVGAAALLNDGTIVTGTNQENAAYPSGLCAERTTLFYANSQYPDQPIKTLAIAARTEKDFIENLFLLAAPAARLFWRRRNATDNRSAFCYMAKNVSTK